MTWNLCAHNNPVWSTLFLLSGFYFKVENKYLLKILVVYNLEEKIEVWIVSLIFFLSFLYYAKEFITHWGYTQNMPRPLKIVFTTGFFAEFMALIKKVNQE